MQRRIIGFHEDNERHWVADLECGHTQHVRHDPPWQERPWVVDEAERRARIGSSLDCPLCDEMEDVARSGRRPPGANLVDIAPAHLSPAAAEAYLDARMQGLCHEGALEIAERLDRKSM